MTYQLPYTGAFAQQNDPDRFFLTLMEASAYREALWTIIAFYHEIAKTREIVSDPSLGYMRLQWWRESLEKIYAGHVTQGHEILVPLAEVIHRYDLPMALFEAVLSSRDHDLDQGTIKTLDEMCQYATDTVAPLNNLVLKILGQRDNGINQISCAYGMTGLLRAIPVYAAKGIFMMPSDLISQDLLFKDEKRRGYVLDLIVQAIQQELATVGKVQSRWLRKQSALCSMQIKFIRSINYDVLDGRYGAQVALQQLRLLVA
ncbi:MAG: squalene/phytoene synthase family protein [Micavibrio sp.]